VKAIRIDERILMTRAVERDREDQFLQSAFNKMTAHIVRPGSRSFRQRYDQVAHGTYKPWRQITEPMQLAMEAGAPEEDVMAIIHTLAGLVHAHYANKECAPSEVKEALRLAIHTQTEEIAAHADAVADPSVANIEKALAATVRDDRADATLTTKLRRNLASLQLRLS
jgi:hypothetical protein